MFQETRDKKTKIIIDKLLLWCVFLLVSTVEPVGVHKNIGFSIYPFILNMSQQFSKSLLYSVRIFELQFIEECLSRKKQNVLYKVLVSYSPPFLKTKFAGLPKIHGRW